MAKIIDLCGEQRGRRTLVVAAHGGRRTSSWQRAAGEQLAAGREVGVQQTAPTAAHAAASATAALERAVGGGALRDLVRTSST